MALKNLIWKVNYKVYPYLRDFIDFTGLWPHPRRQVFLIGHVKPGVTTENVLNILKASGFERDICGWLDDGEVLGYRKLDGKYHQYHLRFFSDSELRGHYEYSPKGAPIKHLFNNTSKPEVEYFRKMFENVLVNN